MLTQIILWAGVALELVLVVRGLQAKLVSKFPWFYCYIGFVLAETVSLFRLYERAPQLYTRLYWIGEFIALILGSLVLFEIYRVALRPYPGTARIARNLLYFVFALAFAKVLVNQSYGSLWWPAATIEELERNLRVVQGFAVLAIAVALIGYSIPCSRNLKGIVFGYGLFVANSIVQLSLLSHIGVWFHTLMVYTQPFSYLVVLAIWTAALWSPATEPVSPRAVLNLAVDDHPSLVARAKQDLHGVDLGFPGAFRR
jgi:hypothetical protein